MRQIRLRVRPGAGVHPLDGNSHYKPAEEFTLSEAEAAEALRGKNRRVLEIVEVIDDADESGGERDDPHRASAWQ